MTMDTFVLRSAYVHPTSGLTLRFQRKRYITVIQNLIGYLEGRRRDDYISADESNIEDRLKHAAPFSTQINCNFYIQISSYHNHPTTSTLLPPSTVLKHWRKIFYIEAKVKKALIPFSPWLLRRTDIDYYAAFQVCFFSEVNKC